jgi:hypothetical protein
MNKPAMSSDKAKAHRERQIFKEFVQKSELPIDAATVESRPAPEPDIRCKTDDGRTSVFELVELCSAELAKEVARLKKRGGDGQFLMLDDPTPQTFLQKIGKTYVSDHPIDLLAYTDGTLVTPDDTIIPVLEDLIQANGRGPFRRIWLLGEKTCCEIAAR